MKPPPFPRDEPSFPRFTRRRSSFRRSTTLLALIPVARCTRGEEESATGRRSRARRGQREGWLVRRSDRNSEERGRGESSTGPGLFPPMIPSNLHASRLGPVAISIRRWLPEGIAYNTIYYGGPPARRNLNRCRLDAAIDGDDGSAEEPLPTDLH